MKCDVMDYVLPGQPYRPFPASKLYISLLCAVLHLPFDFELVYLRYYNLCWKYYNIVSTILTFAGTGTPLTLPDKSHCCSNRANWICSSSIDGAIPSSLGLPQAA